MFNLSLQTTFKPKNMFTPKELDKYFNRDIRLQFLNCKPNMHLNIEICFHPHKHIQFVQPLGTNAGYLNDTH